MASDDKVAVFTDTNLGTNFALSVSPDTTVGDFRGELERTHHSCFPEFGKIEVLAVMVRRKSCFYHLLPSMPIKYAFQRQVGSWFLHIEARTSNDSYDPGDGDRLTNFLVQNTREGTATIRAEPPTNAPKWNTSSMVKKRAHVITGCLLDCSGVSQHPISPGSGRAEQDLPKEQPRTKADNSYRSSSQNDAMPPFMVATPQKESLFCSRAGRDTRTGRDRFGSSGVGKRVVVASNNMRISDKSRPITPLSNFRDGKLLSYKKAYGAKFLVFEISDSDEEENVMITRIK